MFHITIQKINYNTLLLNKKNNSLKISSNIDSNNTNITFKGNDKLYNTIIDRAKVDVSYNVDGTFSEIFYVANNYKIQVHCQFKELTENLLSKSMHPDKTILKFYLERLAKIALPTEKFHELFVNAAKDQLFPQKSQSITALIEAATNANKYYSVLNEYKTAASNSVELLNRNYLIKEYQSKTYENLFDIIPNVSMEDLRCADAEKLKELLLLPLKVESERALEISKKFKDPSVFGIVAFFDKYIKASEITEKIKTDTVRVLKHKY